MANESPTMLHPMSIGDILDGAVRLYRDNFLKLVGVVTLPCGIALVVIIPIGMVAIPFLFGGFDISDFNQENLAENIEDLVSQNSTNLIVFILGIAGGTMIFLVLLLAMIFSYTAAGTMAVSERFLGRPVSIRNIYKTVGTRFLVLLGVSFVTGIGIAMGLAMCILPGILCWVWLSFIPQVVVLENLGFGAIRRSISLIGSIVKKDFWRVCLIKILISIATFLINLLLQLIIGLGIAILNALGADALSTAASIIGTILRYGSFIFIAPFEIAAMTLMYYDLRIRKEGFDIEMMAQSLARK